jgi:hypothetical protein
VRAGARRFGGGLAHGGAVALAAVLLAVVAAGCNSDAAQSQAHANARVAAANRYVAALSVLGDAFRVAEQRFAERTASTLFLPATARRAPALARAAAAYADGVAALAPPAVEARAPQATLVAVVREFATDVRRLGRAASAGRLRAARVAGRAATALAPRLTAATQAIQSALDQALGHGP